MISVIITSFKESKTIVRAINSFISQLSDKDEIIVCTPDNETLSVAKRLEIKFKKIILIKDEGKGKPSALNLAVKKAKGEILILTDGDVWVSNNAISKLLMHFKDKTIGAVSGRVISENSKDNIFGFWAYLLSEGFHYQRMRNREKLCTGYLYAIRKKLMPEIPPEILADDAFVSNYIINKKFKIEYEPAAKVFVKYPNNLPDWIRQKKRTAARFYQLNKYFKISKINSLKEEIISGFNILMKLKSFKHIIWFILLFVMKVYIWFRVFFDFRLWNREFKKVWERVESTK